MKFLFKLLNIAYQYRKEERRYNNFGIGGRIVIFIFMLLFSGLTIASEIWTFSLLKENVVLGILVLILFIALALATLENLCMYSVVAFKRAIRIKRMKNLNNKSNLVVENCDIKDNLNETVSENQNLNENSTEGDLEDLKLNNKEKELNSYNKDKSNNKYRKFDIVVGFVLSFMALILFVTTIFLFIDFIKK